MIYDLIELDQWVLWQYVEPDGKTTKLPYQPNRKPAETNDPSTWRPYAEVCETYRRIPHVFDGIGFVFSSADPYGGIVLDDCLDESGQRKDCARPCVDT